LFSLWLIFRPFFFGGWLLLLIVLLMLVSLGMRIYMFSRRRRYFNGQGGGMRPGPEQILARRFAMGEIDEAEYQRRLAALRNPSASTK
jgi:putative membrane protein